MWNCFHRCWSRFPCWDHQGEEKTNVPESISITSNDSKNLFVINNHFGKWTLTGSSKINVQESESYICEICQKRHRKFGFAGIDSTKIEAFQNDMQRLVPSAMGEVKFTKRKQRDSNCRINETDEHVGSVPDYEGELIKCDRCGLTKESDMESAALRCNNVDKTGGQSIASFESTVVDEHIMRSDYYETNIYNNTTEEEYEDLLLLKTLFSEQSMLNVLKRKEKVLDLKEKILYRYQHNIESRDLTASLFRLFNPHASLEDLPDELSGATFSRIL